MLDQAMASMDGTQFSQVGRIGAGARQSVGNAPTFKSLSRADFVRSTGLYITPERFYLVRMRKSLTNVSIVEAQSRAIPTVDDPTARNQARLPGGSSERASTPQSSALGSSPRQRCASAWIERSAPSFDPS